MSQVDVEEFLKEQAKTTDRWFSAKEIKLGLIEKGCSNGTINGVYDDLYKLAAFEHIEWKGHGVWRHQKLFRAKRNHL